MKNQIYLLILLLIILTSCNRKVETIKSINLDKSLSAIAIKATDDSTVMSNFPFCKIIPIKQWDQMIVVEPYENLERIEKEIHNFSKVSDFLEDRVYNDWLCTLLFLKEKNIIAYAITNRLPIDFAELLANPSRNFSFFKKDCNNFYLKKQTLETQISFKVHLKKN